jgi:translation elongation factor EF-Tu-like GTPase
MDFNLRELEKELAKYESQQRDQLEKLMLRDLVAAIRLDGDNEPIFQGIEFLKKAGEGTKETIDRIRELARSYGEKKESERQKVENDLRKNLERQGISGSAVQIKVEGNREWAEALAGMNASFKEKLQPLLGDFKIPSI